MFKVFEAKSKEVSQPVPWALPQDITLEQVRVTMLDLMAAESINHHRMGGLYNHVVKKRLAEAAGYTDARDYFSKNLKDMSQASLTTYGAVAEKFSEDMPDEKGVVTSKAFGACSVDEMRRALQAKRKPTSRCFFFSVAFKASSSGSPVLLLKHPSRRGIPVHAGDSRFTIVHE